MIIYVAPGDKEMYERTLKYAKEKGVRMIVVSKDRLFKEVHSAQKHRYDSVGGYNFGKSETIWIVGHGNEDEIGDKTSAGVGLDAEYLVSFLKSTLITDKAYQGSIVIDTCKSGVMDDRRKTFADKVFDGMKSDFQNVTVGGWIGNAKGAISQGRTELTEEVFKGEEGFAWAHRTPPSTQSHDVLARLA